MRFTRGLGVSTPFTNPTLKSDQNSHKFLPLTGLARNVTRAARGCFGAGAVKNHGGNRQGRPRLPKRISGPLALLCLPLLAGCGSVAETPRQLLSFEVRCGATADTVQAHRVGYNNFRDRINLYQIANGVGHEVANYPASCIARALALPAKAVAK